MLGHHRSEDPFTLHEGYSVCLDDKMAPEAGRSAEERSLHAGESTATMMSFRVVKPHHEYDTPVKLLVALLAVVVAGTGRVEQVLPSDEVDPCADLQQHSRSMI
ncbi:MAG: hypothetical protein FRX49_10709 [Trebouxia sp. A1-2]|nr:MAG: hypothetical protein FRX49_10709 [Trebouxia sp. A1-2]